jgi:hypothetical protein
VKASRLAMALLALCSLVGCIGDPSAARDTPELDEDFFRCNVQPILTRSCSMFACHGNARRFFVVYARNRLRAGIADESERNVFLSDAELAHNFEAARAMVNASDPAQSPLLSKPLDPSAGGWYHVGGDLPFHGGDPFESAEDPDFLVMQQWVMGARAEDPDCIELGSDM